MHLSKTRPFTLSERNRRQRIMLAVPLRVAGKNGGGKPFAEDTATLIVSATGGLITLKEDVSQGDTLTMENLNTRVKISCRVIEVKPEANGAHEVNVEFEGRNSKFWRVSFPPVDWKKK